MKIDKSKSILNQKCECGRKIDYFQLREHVIAEKMWRIKKFSKISIIILIVLFIIQNILLLLSFFSANNTNNEGELLSVGLMVGCVNGVIISFIYIIYKDYKNIKQFNAKKSRKEFYRHKVRWSYYHSLGKRQRKALVKAMALCIGLAVFPFYMIMIISFIISNTIDGDYKVVSLIIGLIIYIITAMLFSKKIYNKCKKWAIKRTSEVGIDYERFNRGVKR